MPDKAIPYVLCFASDTKIVNTCTCIKSAIIHTVNSTDQEYHRCSSNYLPFIQLIIIRQVFCKTGNILQPSLLPLSFLKLISTPGNLRRKSTSPVCPFMNATPTGDSCKEMFILLNMVCTSHDHYLLSALREHRII